MASFPDLRPHRRSAKAECSAASKSRTRLLLVVSTALLVTAFVAVTELATLRGPKALDTSALLTRELGPPLDSAPLVRKPAHDLKVSISPQGFRVERGPHSLGLALLGGKPQHVTSFKHGISTKTDFGRAVVAVSPKKTEQYLVVDKHHGTKTWSWQLDTAGLTPRVGGDGSVGFIAGHRLTNRFVIAAPKILDLRGRDISPQGLRWDVARREGRWSLQLAFDDSKLAAPYVIDPASYNVGAGTTGPTVAAANIALAVPASVKLGDLLIAHVTWKGGTNITAAQPGGWTQLDQTRNDGVNIGAQVWYKNASVADTTGGTYTWTFTPNAIGTGGIAAYTGIDKSVAPQVSQLVTTNVNDQVTYYPAITPATNGAQVISVLGFNETTANNLTPPLAVGGVVGAAGTNTDRWETANSGHIASELSDFTQLAAAAVNTNGANTLNPGLGKKVSHVAFRIALKADVTNPTSSFSLVSVSPAGSAYYSGSGTTVWYRGTGPNCAAEVQVAGKCSFAIRNSVADAGSGPASSQFSALVGAGTHWTFTNSTVSTPAGGPYDSNFFAWSTGAVEAPTDAIIAADNGGNTDTPGTTLTFTNDVTGPAVPAPTVAAQYYTSLSVPVSTGGETDTGGSGVNASSITVQRDAIGLSAGACGAFTGTWSNVTLSGGNDTTVTNGNCYRYREVAADNVGNSTNSSASNTAKVDSVAPANSLSLTSGSPAGASYKSGNTIFYRGAQSGGGSFKIRNAVSDAASGPASSATAALGGTTTGWTHTPSTVNTPAGGPYDSNSFTWTQNTNSSPTEVVTAADAAGNTTAAATLTLTDDSTAPTVSAPSVTAQYYTSLSVPVTINTGSATDGGSGVDATTSILQRESASLSAGTCTWSGTWSNVTLSAGNDTTVTNGNCYRYHELLSDHVGNQGTSANSNTAKIDTSAPSTPTLAFAGLSSNGYYDGAGTFWFRPSAGGTVTVTALSSDSESGIGSYTFGTLNSNGGSNWGGSQTGDHFDYTFNASTSAPTTSRTVNSTNGAASNSANASYSINADTTGPSVPAPTVTAGYYTSLSVPVSLGSVTDTGGSGPNASTYVVQRDAIGLAGGSCGAFTNSWATVTLSSGNDTTVSNGNCYRYREVAADNVGNSTNSSASNTAKIDAQNPTNSLTTSSASPVGSVYRSGATIYYRGSVAGSFTLTNAVSDGESGPGSSATAALGGTTSGWSHTPSTVSTPSGGPYDSNTFNWSAGTTSSPTEVVTGADTAGNTTASATLTLTNDSAAPSGGALTVNSVAATGATPVSYDTDGSFAIDVRTDYSEGGGESGLASSSLVRTSASFSSADTCGAFASPATLGGNPSQSGLTTGCYKYTLTGTDNVGNATSVATVVKVDTDNPVVSLTDPGTPLAGTIALDATASDASTGIQQVVFQRAPAGGSTWTTIGTDGTAPFTASWDSTGVSDGLYDVRAIATDTAGNTNTSTVTNRRVDNTAPDTTIDSSPSSPSNDGTPTLAFSSSESGSTFQCRLDAGSWSACTSPHTVSPALAEGSHTFDVRATDAAGNTDGSPATRTWTVDLTAPNTTIDSSPASPSGNTTPTFTFSSSEGGSTFECRTDGGSWTACTSPDTISPALGEGSHSFDVRATDQAGNTDTSPASHSWIIDTGPPNTTIDTSPGSPSGDATPTFTFSSNESGSTFECRIDGGGWSSCSSPHTLSALGEGSHIFDVRATDVAANTDPTPASYTWAVDLTAPNTTIDSAPGDPSNDATPSFSFSASEPGSTFECQIDGGGWSSCSSPHTLSALGAGSHSFQVRATDQAGNTDATPASSTWTIDLTAPDTTIDSGPPNPSGNTTPTFTFSSTETGSTFECRIDGGGWSACASPDTISPALAQGSHTFDVRAVDAAGNADGSPASHTWIIDTGAPTVTITDPTTYLNGSDPNNYVVTASTPDSDVARVDFFECSDESASCGTGSWIQFGTDSSSPYSATWSTPAFDGLKAIRAVAVDAASNTGQHVQNITIDRTAPTGVTVGYPNGYVVGSYAITTSNGSDPDVNASTGSLQRETGNLANNACSSYGAWVAATTTDTLASGKCAAYRYSVRDNAGNLAVATSSNETKSDTSAPTSALNDPGANLRQTITLSANASDTDGSGVDSVAFQRRPAGGGSWTTIAADGSSPYSVSFDTTSLGDGLYDFRSVATDTAGNGEASPTVVANRRIDNTAPSATMVSPGNPVGGTVTLTSNTNDTGGSGVATVAYEIAPNGGSFNSQPASWDTTLASDGLYDLRVLATDVAGNTTTSPTVTTRVDNTPPALTFSSPVTGTIVSGTVNLVGSASDASPASPLVTFAYKLHSDPPSAYAATGSSWNTATLPAGDGLYDLRARATDDASNAASIENTSILVDNAPPTVSITAPAAAINGSLPSPTTFAANASDPAGSGVAQVQFFECSDQSNDCATGIWSPLGTVPAPGPYSVSWSIPAADGNHALAAVATDNAGHPATAIRNVNVDRTAPSTTILTKPSDPSNAAIPSFTFDSSEAGSSFECRVDGGSFAPCTSPHNVTGIADNNHTFEVRATDPAGNTDATPATWTWHRDTSDPTGTLNNPGANIRQTATLTSTETDPPANGYASGLQSVAYEYSADGTTWAPIGTLNSPPFDTILWNTAGVADGVYQLRMVVRDVAGNTTTSAAVPNVRIDNTVPTTSQNDPGQYLRTTKTLTGSAADSGSGIDHVDFQRAPTGSGSWTTIATDSTPADGFQAGFDTTSVADGHYDFRTVAYDVAGNQAAATAVTDRLVDNTVPTATINSPGPYLRGAVNLTSSTGDPGGANASGVVTVAYEYSTNGGGTWQSTGASFNSNSVPDGNVDLHVVATDAAGNTTTSAAVTSLADNTKPATTDNAPSGWQSSPVIVTLTPSDGGSGVNVTEYSVDGNPTYTTGTSVSIPAPADGSNDGAHTIAYFSADNAGNIETIKSATVLIDATPPACPSCSAADYLRGTVTLSADPSSGGSGIKSVAFEYTDAGGSTWLPIGTDTTGPGPYTADWDTTAVPDGHYDLRIQITDNANNVTTTSLPDKVVDNTAPNVALVGAPTEGQLVSGTIAIAASASDATSPIASVRFFVRGSLLGADTTAPFSLIWDTTTGADGAATIQVEVEDMAGNTTTSPLRNVSVDNVSPTPTLADPGQYLNGTVSLSASSDPDTTQVDFERRPAGGGSWVTIASDTTTPWGTALDTTSLADGLYDFRAVATDQTGHTGTSPIRSNLRVDNTLPAGSLTTPASGATVGGTSVALSGSYSDGGSGVASVRYELRPTGGGSWATIASSASAPFGASWDATTVSSGSYDMQPVITDRAGNTFTGAMHTITVDVSAPTVVLTNPGAMISGSVTLNATVSGSGATQVAFAATPAGGASWSSLGTDTSAPWSTTVDTLQLQDGVYDLRATVSDNLGNTSFDTVSGIRIDNTAPRVVSSTPGEGTTVPSANAIGLVTSEDATPLGVTLDGKATVAPVVSGTHIDYGTGPLGPGAHTLAGELQDSSGKRAPFRVHFTVWTASSSVAPPVDKNTTASSATTVESADGWASATMPASNWSSSTGDWLVIRITPTAAPTGLTNGFGAGPIAVDVTARWALAGTEVHQFNRAISILLRSTEKGLVPATFENGHWRVLARVPSAGTLPTGWEDGFYTDASGFHVLTTHLSLFALLRDLEAPNPPQNVRGYLGPTGLTLRWTPGSDNSGTYDFVTVFSNSTDAGHFGVDYNADTIGGWSPGDTRIFRLKETDLAGNESTLTPALRPVPSLIGKTPDQVAALLAQLGLEVGTITIGGTGPAGTITGPAGLVLAQEGSAIDLTVAPGGGLTRLVLKVTTAPRAKPAVRKSIAARVSLTRASRVTAELFSPRRVKLYTWRFSLRAGRSIVRLRLPPQVRRPGVYTMRWTARSGREAISRKITIRLMGTRNVTTVPARVVLAGPAARGINGTFPTQKPKLITASGIEPTFDAAASRRTNVRVIVVDVDAFGVSLIRDLHAVFPATKIVALTSGPRQMAASLKAGAAIALPRSTPASTLGRLIQRLLAKRSSPVK